jgi:hypothetical protein
MARRTRAKNSNDTLKYFLIGTAALVVLFLVFNVAPTGKYYEVDQDGVVTFYALKDGNKGTFTQSECIILGGSLDASYCQIDDVRTVDTSSALGCEAIGGSFYTSTGIKLLDILDSSNTGNNWYLNHFFITDTNEDATGYDDRPLIVDLQEETYFIEVSPWDFEEVQIEWYRAAEYEGTVGFVYLLSPDEEAVWSNNLVTNMLTDLDYENKFLLEWGECTLPLDSDSDEVYDSFDVCSDTDEDTTVNAAGCPDTDGDGIFDNLDQCPDDAPTTDTDGDGCQDNQPPTFGLTLSSTSAEEETKFTYQISASDADQDTLSYSITISPPLSELSVVETTGAISGTLPTVTQDETYTVTMAVSDGIATVTNAFTLTITPANDPPAFTPGTLPDISREEGSSLQGITAVATDPDGNPTHYFFDSTSELTAELLIDEFTGEISGTLPSFSDVDTNVYTVVVEASDGDGNAATESFSITVESANQPPTIETIAQQLQIEGTPYTEQVSASDLDGDTLTYGIATVLKDTTNAFAFLSIDSDGEISGTLPGVSQNTIYSVTVTVTDDATPPASAQTSFDIAVLSDADSDGVADYVDNCPDNVNPLQEDGDIDGEGDACDDDWDNDGELNDVDNCPNDANPLQEDADSDGTGDTCDDDIDGDTILNDADYCADTNQASDYNSDDLSNVNTNGCTPSQTALSFTTLQYRGGECWTELDSGDETGSAILIAEILDGAEVISYQYVQLDDLSKWSSTAREDPSLPPGDLGYNNMNRERFEVGIQSTGDSLVGTTCKIMLWRDWSGEPITGALEVTATI